MIPKTIHYIWFGGNPHTKLQKKCMKSWKKYCPDWEIKRWDESSFDISSAPKYVQDAYQAKKWAFVSDYVRLKVLYEYGGVYLDTDAQILKDISPLIENEAFLAFEHNEMVNSGVCGSEAGNRLLKEFLQHYEELRFFDEEGKMVTTVTGEYLTKVFLSHGLLLNGQEQIVENWRVYPFTYFYPVKVINDRTYYSENTCICHWFEGTWISEDNAKARAHDINPFIAFMRKRKIMKIYYYFRNRGKQ